MNLSISGLDISLSPSQSLTESRTRPHSTHRPPSPMSSPIDCPSKSRTSPPSSRTSPRHPGRAPVVRALRSNVRWPLKPVEDRELVSGGRRGCFKKMTINRPTDRSTNACLNNVQSDNGHWRMMTDQLTRRYTAREVNGIQPVTWSINRCGIDWVDIT